MAVPGEVVWICVRVWVVGMDGRRIGRGFDLSEDFRAKGLVTCFEKMRVDLTVALDVAIYALNDTAEIRPFSEILEVEAYIVGFGEMV